MASGSRQQGWVGWSSIAVVAIATIAFILADPNGGSGFMATFDAGLMCGYMTRDKIQFTELLAADVGLALVKVSFLMFGALILLPELGDITRQVVVMVVLALTVARIVPVAIAMVGTGLKVPSIPYMGWFGPRGLATIVYAALVTTSSQLRDLDDHDGSRDHRRRECLRPWNDGLPGFTTVRGLVRGA